MSLNAERAAAEIEARLWARGTPERAANQKCYLKTWALVDVLAADVLGRLLLRHPDAASELPLTRPDRSRQPSWAATDSCLRALELPRRRRGRPRRNDAARPRYPALSEPP
jgi:hypothetical protein